MDTINTGAVIGFVMELWEKEIIEERDSLGIDLSWGDPPVIVDLIEKIAMRIDFGDLLAEGTHRVSQHYGDKAQQYEMTVKGLDIPGQDGRAQKSMGLSHATANRGADHLTSAEFLSEVGFPDLVQKRFDERAIELYGRSIMPEGADRLDPKFKPLMVLDSEHLSTLADSLVICKFSTHWPPIFYFEDLAKALTLATGVDYDEKDLRLIGERIFILERCFNLREGFSAQDDVLPKRFLNEPSPSGGAMGHTVELDVMIKEYYRLRDLDKDGFPSSERMKHLGLKDVADQLGIE
jgi:aldehyde:ferredoxin oxidoreductase